MKLPAEFDFTQCTRVLDVNRSELGLNGSKVAATLKTIGGRSCLFGDLFAYGPDSVRFYTRRKTITQRWPSGGVREKAQFSFPSNQ